MAASKSSSSSSSATTSNSEDNRIVNDNGGLVLGKDAGIIVNQEFGDNVLKGFQDLVGLVRDAGQVVVTSSSQAQQSAANSISAVTSAIQNDKLGTSTTESTIVKYIPLMLGVAVILFLFRKKG